MESQKLAPSLAKNKECQLLLGVSLFPQESSFLSKKQLLKSVQSIPKKALKKTFFVLTLALDKQEQWIISKKVFFILSSGERKEISHLTYKDILALTNTNSKNLLSLDQALLYLPKKASFLLHLLGSNRQKMIKNLDKALLKTKRTLYVSSENERLLKELKTQAFSYQFKILHSYKSLIRMEMMSVLPSPFKNFQGEGIMIPELFSSINLDALDFLRQNGKLIFLEKEPPYKKEDRLLLQSSSALISSQPAESLKDLEDTSCF